jgi:hypothetical protein
MIAHSWIRPYNWNIFAAVDARKRTQWTQYSSSMQVTGFIKIVTYHKASIAGGGGQSVRQDVLPLRVESMLLRPAATSL